MSSYLRRAWPVLALLAWFWLSHIWTVQPTITNDYSTLMTVEIGAYCVIGAVLGVERSARLLAYALTVGIWLSVLFWWRKRDLAFGDPLLPDLLNGAYPHRNYLAFACILAIPVWAWACIRKPKRSFVGVPTIAAAIVLIARSGAKTPIVTGAFAGAFLVAGGAGMIALRRTERRRGRSTQAVTACVLAFVLSAAVVAGAGWSVASQSPYLRTQILDNTKLTNRTPLWGEIMPLAMRQPIAGYGAGQAFWISNKGYRQLVTRRLTFDEPHAHNSFLEMFLSGGAVALALYVLIVVRAVRRSADLLRRARKPADVASMLLVAALMIVLILGAFNEDVVFYGANFAAGILIWIGTPPPKRRSTTEPQLRARVETKSEAPEPPVDDDEPPWIPGGPSETSWIPGGTPAADLSSSEPLTGQQLAGPGDGGDPAVVPGVVAELRSDQSL